MKSYIITWKNKETGELEKCQYRASDKMPNKKFAEKWAKENCEPNTEFLSVETIKQ